MPDSAFDQLSPEEQILALRKENKRLQRQHKSLQDLLGRSRAAALARSNIDAVFAEEKARQEKYMSLLPGNCPDIILLFDKDGRLAYCTDAFLRQTGISHRGLLSGRLYQDVFSSFPDSAWIARLDDLRRRSMEHQGSETLEEMVDFSGQGQARNYRVHFTPMVDDAGQAVGAMLMFHDVTDLLRATEEAVRASNAKSEFLSNMSHEIRTPMNAITSMAKIGRSTDDKDRKDYCLDKIDEASTHLLGVVNDILDMSKIEAHKFELSYAEFDFERMLLRVCDVVNYRIDEKEQKFELNLEPHIPRYVVGDEQRLAQVLTNLLSNAVKFTPEQGHISLAASLVAEDPVGMTLRMTVKDDGIGIPLEQQGKLFTSFAQADSGIARKFGGTGLGLAISKRIVNMMEDKIVLASAPGQGSSFTFTVRLQRGEHLSPATEEIQADAVRQKGCFAAYRILLAEDVEINREIVLALLENTGLVIDCAVDGREAFAMVKENLDVYGFIFMDVQMPEQEGYETTRQIRALPHPKAATIPIVAMTANVFREDVDKCLAAGMDDHMGKPLDLDEVLRKLREYLPRKASFSGQPVSPS